VALWHHCNPHASWEPFVIAFLWLIKMGYGDVLLLTSEEFVAEETKDDELRIHLEGEIAKEYILTPTLTPYLISHPSIFSYPLPVSGTTPLTLHINQLLFWIWKTI
jgi:hypothetical protein